MHVIGTERALTGICWFLKSWQGHFYLKRLLSFQLFVQQIVIPNHVPSHPSLSLEDQPGELGMASAANTEKVGWQQWRRPKDCLQWPPPLTHLPRLDSDSQELGADSREERTILYSSQPSLQGNKTICDSFGKGKERRIWGGILLIYKV